MRISGPNSESTFPKHAGGFTFVEVIIAVGIVLLLFISLTMGIAFCVASTRIERENVRATQVILERMEGIHLFTWDQLLNTSMNPTLFTNHFTPLGANQGIAYQGTMTVTPNPSLSPAASYSTNMLLVTVAVEWSSAGRLFTRSMSTYVSKNGVQNYVYNN